MCFILLAMHGAPPRDFPPAEMGEFMQLHAGAGHGSGDPPGRRDELERRMRAWPRTPLNDPFHAASLALGRVLEAETGMPVIVAFNEFCDPDVDDGLEQAVARGATEVIVVTPMLTPGGEHAEIDLPEAIERTRRAHPEVTFRYAWPIPLEATAAFLAKHIQRAARDA